MTYLNEGRFSSDDRAELAYELARWKAAQGDWAQSLDLLDKAAKLNTAMVRLAEPTALLLEAQMRLGRLDLAQTTLNCSRQILTSTEYAFAKSNLLLLQKGKFADAERLDLLNKVYSDAGLKPLKLIDPDGALDMDNLVGQAVMPVVANETVTVIIPVFEAAAHLDTALRAVCEQSYRNLEIIVIDDASGDSSWEIIQQHAAKDDRIIALQNEENAGAYRTRNRGLRQATGYYLTVHDSDDWSHPQMIEKQVAVFARHGVCGVFGTALRTSAGLHVEVDPKRATVKMMRRCYPGFMARRLDFLSLGAWDEVRVGADDEMVFRFSAVHGNVNLHELPFTVALTLQRLHETSLTQNAETSISSNFFGMRSLYKQQHSHWREQQLKLGASLKLIRKSKKDPFPIPNAMWQSARGLTYKYDFVIISDFALLGGTRRCNEGYVSSALANGLKVGLFHYPSWGLEMKPIAPSYFDLCNKTNVDFLSKEDLISSELVILHHPPLMSHYIDDMPSIKCGTLAVLVNQSPMNLRSEQPWMYDPLKAKRFCNHFFGKAPIWIPISDRVRKTLDSLGGYEPMLERNWHPPFSGSVVDGKTCTKINRPITIGRHSRDHWTKWPSTRIATDAAYCANVDGVEIYLLGGVKSQPKTSQKQPNNWTVFEFDTIPVNDFLDSLDIFVNFMHHDYIEEFGRNTMEAMARGKPVILEHGLVDTFGDAAIYCEPSEVAENVHRLMSDPDLYQTQVAKGLCFVRKYCSQDTARKNIRDLIASAQ